MQPATHPSPEFPGRPGFHASLSGRRLGGAVALGQTQANKATHAQPLSRNLSRERRAASISAAVSGGRHPSGGACVAHAIERETLQIRWRRMDFRPRLIGRSRVLADNQLQRCVHDFLVRPLGSSQLGAWRTWLFQRMPSPTQGGEAKVFR